CRARRPGGRGAGARQVLARGDALDRRAIHATRDVTAAPGAKDIQTGPGAPLVGAQSLNASLQGWRKDQMGIRVSGIGGYVPARTMTNLELAMMVDTSDEWIMSRTGIRERRLAGPEEAPSDL